MPDSNEAHTLPMENNMDEMPDFIWLDNDGSEAVYDSEPPKEIPATKYVRAPLAAPDAGKVDCQDELVRQAIRFEKMLCSALGREWQASGISVETLIAELKVAAPGPTQPRAADAGKAGVDDCPHGKDGLTEFYQHDTGESVTACRYCVGKLRAEPHAAPATDGANDIIDIALEAFWAKTRENTDDRLLADEAIRMRSAERKATLEGRAELVEALHKIEAWFHNPNLDTDMFPIDALEAALRGRQ